MDRQTLSIMKACEVVGVSRRTIYNWISAGKVEYVRTAGGAIRIAVDGAVVVDVPVPVAESRWSTALARALEGSAEPDRVQGAPNAWSAEPSGSA